MACGGGRSGVGRLDCGPVPCGISAIASLPKVGYQTRHGVCVPWIARVSPGPRELGAFKTRVAPHGSRRIMLFNSQLFLIVFLPVALALQWIVAEHTRWWIANLLFLSAIFYSYWNPPLLLLLVGLAITNRLCERPYRASPRTSDGVEMSPPHATVTPARGDRPSGTPGRPRNCPPIPGRTSRP